MPAPQVVWAPCEIRPSDLGVPPSADGLAELLASWGPALDSQLLRDKALVFRGFQVAEAALDPVLDLLLPGRLRYLHGNSPRSKVGAEIYTSTEYPAEYTISMHSELSYSSRWPARVLFYCVQPAASGGATSVLDAEQWLLSLDDEVRSSYAGGIRYVQNLHGGTGLGRSWQESFETADRDRVDQFLAEVGAEWQWHGDGLRIAQVRPATMRHPVTSTEVWFSQSDQWHPACLGEAGAELARLLPAEDLPQSVSFADGRPIPAEYVLQIRDRGLTGAFDLRWQAGDLLLIDNVLVAHGRRPYTGSRRVLVAMSA